MKTSDLIRILATGAGSAPRQALARTLGPAVTWGLIASVVLSLTVIGPLPGARYTSGVLWLKLMYALLIAGAGLVLTVRLARPLAALRGAQRTLSLVVSAMAVIAALQLSRTPADAWPQALLGRTWWFCPWLLATFSLPAMGALLWAMRSLAPTRLAQAGQACGLLAGALGAAGYALACPESSVAFVAVWYTVGIALMALLGRWLGPLLLRW